MCMQAELQAILHHESLARAGILILANKQDLRDAMTVEELSTALGLTGIRDHPWHIQPSCALKYAFRKKGLGRSGQPWVWDSETNCPVSASRMSLIQAKVVEWFVGLTGIRDQPWHIFSPAAPSSTLLAPQKT